MGGELTDLLIVLRTKAAVVAFCSTLQARFLSELSHMSTVISPHADGAAQIRKLTTCCAVTLIITPTKCLCTSTLQTAAYCRCVVLGSLHFCTL